jgi:hypothetical protein
MNRPARLNRVLLALIGVTAIAAGVLVHFLEGPLIPGTVPMWSWYVVAAVAIVVGLLLLRWLLAQLAVRPPARTWQLESAPERGRTELRTSVAIAPFVKEISGYPGVRGARATLTGPRDQPFAAIEVEAEQDGDLTAIRERLDATGLPRLRRVLDLDELPVTVEFRLSAHPGPRVR